jgi:hypothetical protein
MHGNLLLLTSLLAAIPLATSRCHSNEIFDDEASCLLGCTAFCQDAGSRDFKCINCAILSIEDPDNGEDCVDDNGESFVVLGYDCLDACSCEADASSFFLGCNEVENDEGLICNADRVKEICGTDAGVSCIARNTD